MIKYSFHYFQFCVPVSLPVQHHLTGTPNINQSPKKSRDPKITNTYRTTLSPVYGKARGDMDSKMVTTVQRHSLFSLLLGPWVSLYGTLLIPRGHVLLDVICANLQKTRCMSMGVKRLWRPCLSLATKTRKRLWRPCLSLATKKRKDNHDRGGTRGGSLHTLNRNQQT